MSKVRIPLIIGTCLGLAGCTPAEVQIVEEVAHEAVVAEQAIENDLECPGEASQYHYSAQQGCTAIKNQRQYPKRGRRDFSRGA